MKSLKEKIAVMQAALDGKDIEQSHFTEEGWMSVRGSISWNWNAMDYRIKPEPMEFWVNVYPASIGEIFYLTDDKTSPVAENCLRTIKVREVTE